MPHNNALQAVDVAQASEEAITQARVRFEGTWNRYNDFRALMAAVVSVLLILLLLVL